MDTYNPEHRYPVTRAEILANGARHRRLVLQSARTVVTRDGYVTEFNAQSDAGAKAYKAGWADALAEVRDEESVRATPDPVADHPSLADNPPPVHIETGMCVGRHRAFVLEAAEELIRANSDWSPLFWRRDESGCAALAPLLIAAVMVGVLFLGVSAFLNAMPR